MQKTIIDICQPPFVRVYDEEPIIIHDYILQIDFKNQVVSIINLKKGGKDFMVKTVVKALEGFEDIFELIRAKQERLGFEKDEAIKVAIAEVDARFAADADRLDKALADVSVTEEIEVPDEIEITDNAAEEVGNIIDEASVDSDEMNV